MFLINTCSIPINASFCIAVGGWEEAERMSLTVECAQKLCTGDAGDAVIPPL